MEDSALFFGAETKPAFLLALRTAEVLIPMEVPFAAIFVRLVLQVGTVLVILQQSSLQQFSLHVVHKNPYVVLPLPLPSLQRMLLEIRRCQPHCRIEFDISSNAYFGTQGLVQIIEEIRKLRKL